MKRIATLFLLSFLITITSSCAHKETAIGLAPTANIAVFTSADKERKEFSAEDQKELQRVMTWLNRDIQDLFRDNGFTTVLLINLKDYSSHMGPLFIVNVEFFNPGVTASLPGGRLGNPVSSLDLSYKLLDERGALLTDWQDGEHSIKGGTYCARTLNRRAAAKIAEFFQSR
jgi:hypothetical protein